MHKEITTKVSKSPVINVGIIGFGLSGQVFHAPFIDVNPFFKLHTIVTTGTLAAERYPGVKTSASPDTLLADSAIDLVIVCSPNNLHFTHAMAVLKSGKHVIVEKPFTVNSEEAQILIETALNSGKKLFPFHNRRWDSDFLTVKQIIEQGHLGRIVDFESRFDRFTPEISRAAWRYNQEAGGGTLFDLGIHLIDQTLSLFGSPEGVFCRLFNQRKGSITDDSFDLKLIYPELNVTLKAGVFVKEPGPRFQVHGTSGSFVKYGIDCQEAMLRQGKKPGSSRFGIEPTKQEGILNTVSGIESTRVRYKTIRGNYMAFFDNVYSAIVNNAGLIIKPADAFLNIRIIETAQQSHKDQRIVNL